MINREGKGVAGSSEGGKSLRTAPVLSWAVNNRRDFKPGLDGLDGRC